MPRSYSQPDNEFKFACSATEPLNAKTENGANSMSDTGNESTVDLSDIIDWSAGDQEPSRFITNTIVQVGDSELTLLLFEVMTPYVQSPLPQEKWVEKWKAKLPLHATCYGRFVLTPERCEQLIVILDQQLTLYWDNVQKKREEMERQRTAEENIRANSQSQGDED